MRVIVELNPMCRSIWISCFGLSLAHWLYPLIPLKGLMSLITRASGELSSSCYFFIANKAYLLEGQMLFTSAWYLKLIIPASIMVSVFKFVFLGKAIFFIMWFHWIEFVPSSPAPSLPPPPGILHLFMFSTFPNYYYFLLWKLIIVSSCIV